MSRKVQLNKGAIQDNALKALVKSNLFRHKVERNKKGKGGYNRQQAKKWQDGSFESSCFVLVEAAWNACQQNATALVFTIRYAISE